MPWDMSTVDLAGNHIEGRGDGENGPKIGLALGVVLIVALIVDRVRTRSQPVVLAGAGAWTWALLFAWRAAVSRVGGANMWPIGFVLVVAPAAVLGTAVVAGITEWLRVRTARRAPSP